MRILIDTNIIIHREANRVFNEDIGLLFNWLDKLKFDKCVHPLSIEEISGYQDEDVVKTMKIKIANYNLLKTESADDQLITQIRQSDKSRNDFIDTSILNEVYNNRVDFLITEDRGGKTGHFCVCRRLFVKCQRKNWTFPCLPQKVFKMFPGKLDISVFAT